MDRFELRRRRKAIGLSQAELGERLGLTGTFVGMMERGERDIAPRTIFGVSALTPGSDADPGALDRPLLTSDPLERMVEASLQRAGVDYLTDRGGGNPTRLDFYLPDLDVSIEVKRFHTDRIAEQMARADNVIALQGEGAVRLFCLAIDSSKLAEVAAALKVNRKDPS